MQTEVLETLPILMLEEAGVMENAQCGVVAHESEMVCEIVRPSNLMASKLLEIEGSEIFLELGLRHYSDILLETFR